MTIRVLMSLVLMTTGDLSGLVVQQPLQQQPLHQPLPLATLQTLWQHLHLRRHLHLLPPLFMMLHQLLRLRQHLHLHRLPQLMHLRHRTTGLKLDGLTTHQMARSGARTLVLLQQQCLHLHMELFNPARLGQGGPRHTAHRLVGL